MFVAIAQDMQIRSASNNEKSLAEKKRFMFNNYTGSSYNIGDVERALNTLNNDSQEDFFNRYIVGTERIPLSQYLELANIETIQNNGQTIFRIREEPDKDKSKIRSGFFGQ